MRGESVARIERTSEIRERLTTMAMLTPGFASFNPGYGPLISAGRAVSVVISQSGEPGSRSRRWP
jgi:hypothetical protein